MLSYLVHRVGVPGQGRVGPRVVRVRKLRRHAARRKDFRAVLGGMLLPTGKLVAWQVAVCATRQPTGGGSGRWVEVAVLDVVVDV